MPHRVRYPLHARGERIAEDPAARKRFEPESDVGNPCRDRCFANGRVMRSVEERMVLSPPLTITHAESYEIVELARRSLDEAADEIAGGGPPAAGARDGAHT